MTRFNMIDLSQLPAPQIVEELSFEAIFEQAKADLIALDQASDTPLGLEAVLALESEPLTKLLQAYAYRELNVRQRINEAVLAGMLAFAEGSDLDQLAANMSVARKTLEAGDEGAVPPVLPVMETDGSLRRRTQLAPEAMTSAGSAGSYQFNALSAGETPTDIEVISPEPGKITITYDFDPESLASLIKQASVISPEPGQVIVTVLGHDGDGVVSDDVLNQVSAHLNDQYVRPLTDRVIVQAANILTYTVSATLHIYDGPDEEVVYKAAITQFWAFVGERHNLGEQVTTSGIDAALHVAGVQKVTLDSWTDITATEEQAPLCEELILTVEVAS